MSYYHVDYTDGRMVRSESDQYSPLTIVINCKYLRPINRHSLNYNAYHLESIFIYTHISVLCISVHVCFVILSMTRNMSPVVVWWPNLIDLVLFDNSFYFMIIHVWHPRCDVHIYYK